MNQFDRNTTRAPSRKSGRSTGFLLLALALVAVGSWGWQRFRPAPDVSLPTDRSTLDAEVLEVVDAQIAVVRENPRDAQAHARLGLVYEANELWQEAERAYGAAISLDGGEALWDYHRALVLTEMGNNTEAAAMLEAASQRLPTVAAPHHTLGMVRLEQGDLAGAKECFDRARMIAPDAYEPLVGLGEVYNQQERFGEAVDVLERAVAIAAQDKAAHYALGIAYRGLGRMDDAQRELAIGVGAKRPFMGDRFSSEKAQLASTYVGQFTKAVNYIDAKRQMEGAAILEKLLRQRPDDTNIYNNLAAAYIEEGLYPRASELLKKLVELKPGEFAAYINLSACALGMNKPAEALQHADRAVQLAPQVGKTHYLRARALTALQMFPEAYATLKKSVSLDSREPMAYIALAEISSIMQRPTEAVEHYKTAVSQDPNYLPAWVSLVQLYVSMNRLDEARAALAEAEKLAPDHQRVQAARRNLELAR